jgi:hypothetical protein
MTILFRRRGSHGHDDQPQRRENKQLNLFELENHMLNKIAIIPI